jgi:hypothetical protein
LLQPYLLPAEEPLAKRRRKRTSRLDQSQQQQQQQQQRQKLFKEIEEGRNREEEDPEKMGRRLGYCWAPWRSFLERCSEQQGLDLMVQLPEVQLVVLRAVLLALQVQSQAALVTLAGNPQ